MTYVETADIYIAALFVSFLLLPNGHMLSLLNPWKKYEVKISIGAYN